MFQDYANDSFKVHRGRHHVLSSDEEDDSEEDHDDQELNNSPFSISTCKPDHGLPSSTSASEDSAVEQVDASGANLSAMSLEELGSPQKSKSMETEVIALDDSDEASSQHSVQGSVEKVSIPAKQVDNAKSDDKILWSIGFDWLDDSAQNYDKGTKMLVGLKVRLHSKKVYNLKLIIYKLWKYWRWHQVRFVT